MGRASLIVVLGFIVIFGFVRGNINKTSENAAANSSEYTETLLARNIANMATEYAVSIYAETGVDSGIVDSNFMGGSYSAIFTQLGTDPIGNNDTLQLTVSSQYEDESHLTRVLLISMSTVMPVATGSGSFKSPNVDYFFLDSILISGIDTNMDGTPGPAPALPALTVYSSADSVALAAEVAANPEWLQGSSAIAVDNTPLPVDLTELFSYYQSIADMSFPADENFNNVNWGTEADPVVVYVDGDCSFRGISVGYGIFAVNGNLRMYDNPTWYGLVLVHGDTTGPQDTRIEDNSKIIGGLVSDAPAPNVRLTNFAEIRYSSEALNMVRTALESTGGIASTRILKEIIWYE